MESRAKRCLEWVMPILIILSSIFFALGHVFVSWSPFYLSCDIVRLFTAFALGIFYAIVYLHTKSIFAPILTHNYSDLFFRLATLSLG